jgi:hypothetical protein
MRYRGHTATGACNNTQVETASNLLCECEDSAEIKSCYFGKHFVEPSYHEEIPLRNTLYFAEGTVLLDEWKILGRKIAQKMVAVQESPY